ncbi:phosphodiester glycosidase family protein [Kineococcus sp. NPDC059986]|uniref:phosphodiester glycosidase family protein n=1 Tax=Kineococcus sp. NPDC059986 TaxID=3155538 RepID=UPI00344DA39D
MRRRTVLSIATLSASGLLVPPRALAAVSGQDGREVVAPGVVLERSTSAGPVRQVLVRLAAGASTRPVLLQQSLSAPRTPAELATAAGAVVAVNGDFFDIDRTGTPDGPVVLDGVPLKSSAAPQAAVGVEAGPGGWRGRVGSVSLQGTATVAGRTYALAALCTRTVPADALALFGPAWGAGDRALTTAGGVELEVRAGTVTAVRPPGPVPVPADGAVLVATGAAAAALAGTPLGSPVVTDVRVLDDALTAGSGGFAVGARLELVRDGAVAPIDETDPTWAALRARTALGWTAAGDLLLLTVEGGTARSRGTTAVQTARRMLDAGAVGAVMLDGGGSAQLVARVPGDPGVSEAVVPSDGAARPVAHVVALVPAVAGPQARSVVLRPVVDAPAGVAVFPGLATLLLAVPVTASGAPTSGAPVLTVAAGGVTLEDRGVDEAGRRRVAVRGVTTGRATVRADLGTDLGAATGSLDVEVLGPPVRLATDRPLVLPGPGSTLDVVVTARDATGREAVLDAAGLRVGTDPTVLSAVALPDGRLRLTAVAGGPAPTWVRLVAGGADEAVPAAVGTRPLLVDPLSSTDAWSVATVRAAASVAAVEGPALRLAFDLTVRPGEPGTATAALVARVPVAVPRGATALAVSVRGDGAGGWLRGVLRVDGASRPVTFAARVGVTGWQRLVVDLPADADEVLVERLYLAQTSVAARGVGALDLARLEAEVPPLPSAASDVTRRTRARS